MAQVFHYFPTDFWLNTFKRYSPEMSASRGPNYVQILPISEDEGIWQERTVGFYRCGGRPSRDLGGHLPKTAQPF